MKTAHRPVLFVGSSTERHEIAKELEALLVRSCEVELWSKDVFVPSQGALESLVQALERFDFAVLVLSPDDLVIKRGKAADAPRDNVLFELGLFMGGIGRERTYMLHEKSKRPELPTDLTGINAVTYELHSSGSIAASLGLAAAQIEQQIQRLGLRGRQGSSRVIHFNLGVNLGWLQQGVAFGARPISLMLADLERVIATAADAEYASKEAMALIVTVQDELTHDQCSNNVLKAIIDLINIFKNQAGDISAAALNLGVVLGRLQQGVVANNFPPSEAPRSLESARSYASKAQYHHTYNGFIDNALTKINLGEPVISISLEVTHLMGLFQGQC